MYIPNTSWAWLQVNQAVLNPEQNYLTDFLDNLVDSYVDSLKLLRNLQLYFERDNIKAQITSDAQSVSLWRKPSVDMNAAKVGIYIYF